MSQRYLPDVNVWVALLDEAHVFHAQALAFIQRKRLKIATCALVENGVVRVLNLPGYSRLWAGRVRPCGGQAGRNLRRS